MSTAAIPDDPQIRERFSELKPALTAQAAVIEADRCLNCFDAPCTAACPTHIDVPGFIKRIASGNLRGSAVRILDANILGASCARVCPVDVLCEGACVMVRQNRKPIQIALLQRHAMDAFWEAGERLPVKSAGAKKLRVACIGGGPASLACAAELCRQGAQATVIERRELPGGLNTYGVAEYKLRAADSVREVEMIRGLGVEFRCGVDVESAAALDALEAEFDIIFLGLGLGAMQRLNIPGEDSEGVMNALELIAAYKTGHLRELHGTVVVVGAGNTAIDAANAAKRLGAETVYMLYRRSEAEMSAFEFEYEHAKQEGVQFMWHRVPMSIKLDPDAHGRLLLYSVQVKQANGQFEAVPHSELAVTCDLVVPAVGQSPLTELLGKLRGVEVKDGRILADRLTGQTGNKRYFAGGDCVNGGREVVDAVAGGKRAAMAMLKAAEVADA
ncbi:Glutamate synthase (NADPH) small subunit [Candidatus Sulfotelmatomonas gaucii]|uniref:Glutamate synthase (NADPH) small subunit n=1 Tax=Candidatus Sulfuritelmatomonas gaucii TaxID=2043161 RepID=A0A2N9L7H0_9BACT|nr:Glutamate synthase (NADPH) small subunit [Candidatus Sulfotelmatomonas gaucii]